MLKHLFANKYILALGLIGIIMALFWGGYYVISVIEEIVRLQHAAAEAMIASPLFVVILLVYTLLLAVPFVPSAELGILLLVVFGVDVAVYVYLATLGGMSLSFAIGRLVPRRVLVDLCQSMGLTKLATHIADETHQFQNAIDPRKQERKWLSRLLRYRYLALALIINLPGNTLIGGGGGIALAAGLSRLYRPIHFFLTLMLAVAPIPILFLLLS